MRRKQKENELLNSILNTKEDLIVANRNFEEAEDDLIDYYSYQIKANKAKFNYLIKQIKKKNINIDMINNLEIALEKQDIM